MKEEMIKKLEQAIEDIEAGKTTGIKRAAGTTKICSPYDSIHVEVYYDIEKHTINCETFVGSGWLEFDDPDSIISVTFGMPATMADIREALVDEAYSKIDALEKGYERF